MLSFDLIILLIKSLNSINVLIDLIVFDGELAFQAIQLIFEISHSVILFGEITSNLVIITFHDSKLVFIVIAIPMLLL